MTTRRELSGIISAVLTAQKRAKAARDDRDGYVNTAVSNAKAKAEKRADDKIAQADIKVAEAKEAYRKFTGQSWVETAGE